MISVKSKRIRSRQVPCDDCGETIKRGEQVFEVRDDKNIPIERLCRACLIRTGNAWRAIMESMDL